MLESNRRGVDLSIISNSQTGEVCCSGEHCDRYGIVKAVRNVQTSDRGIVPVTLYSCGHQDCINRVVDMINNIATGKKYDEGLSPDSLTLVEGILIDFATFRPGVHGLKTNCINNHATRVCLRPATQEAVLPGDDFADVRFARCCDDPHCMARAVELLLNKGEREKIEKNTLHLDSHSGTKDESPTDMVVCRCSHCRAVFDLPATDLQLHAPKHNHNGAICPGSGKKSSVITLSEGSHGFGARDLINASLAIQAALAKRREPHRPQ